MTTPTLAALVALTILAVAWAAPADAAKTPRVYVQVVGQTSLLAGWQITTPSAFSLRVPGTCSIRAATPLAGLEQVRRQTGPEYTAKSSCSKPTVSSIGDEAATSQRAWVYKVGRRRGTSPAKQALKAGDKVLWFRCAKGKNGCRRTLELTPSAIRAAKNAKFTVTVRGYDDKGRGIAVEGATVNANNVTATTDAKGRATLTAPPQKGPFPIFATGDRMADAFPARVTVG